MKRAYHDPFSAVLGDKRGKQEGDTILSHRPTDAGREDLDTYIADMVLQNFDRTLHLLANNRALIGQRPLLGQLASEFCRYLVSQSALSFDDAIRHFLDATSVYPAQGGHLLLVADQRQRVRGQTGPQTRSLHVWPAGHQWGPLACLGEKTSVVCGLEVTAAAWRRVDRGTWQAENLADLGWKRCEGCEKSCPTALRYVLKETSRYVPYGAELYRRMLRAITQRTVKRLAAGEFATVDDAREIANRTYREMLLPAAVTYATQAGEAAVQWMLDARQWRTLVRAYGQNLAPLLSSDDWKEALGPCVPALAADGSLILAGEEEFAAARTRIIDTLTERSGAVSPAERAVQLNI